MKSIILFCGLLLPPLTTAVRAQPTPPAILANGGYIRDQGNPRVIIFLHGLGGSPDSWRCDESHYWPSMVAADGEPSLQKSDVYVVAYPTRDGMTVADLNTLIVSRLAADGVFSRHEQIVIVAHSLGGIVAQSLFLTYRDKELYKKVKFLYLFATPQEGSKLANLGSHFSRNPLLRELSAGDGNFILQGMNEEWLHSGFTSIKKFCAYETQKVHGFKVVDRNSATRGCADNIAINANHESIIKPCSTQDTSYIELKKRLNDLDAVVSPILGSDVKIAPQISLDQKEAFLEQFSVTNTSDHPIYDLDFACSVMYILYIDGTLSPLLSLKPEDRMVMVPVMNSIPQLESHKSTTMDCDYLFREKGQVKMAHIELIAAYKLSANAQPLYSSQEFTARQDSLGQFQWTYGAPEPGIFTKVSGSEKRILTIVPFAGESRFLSPRPDPQKFFDMIVSWSNAFYSTGGDVMLSTMISGIYE